MMPCRLSDRSLGIPLFVTMCENPGVGGTLSLTRTSVVCQANKEQGGTERRDRYTDDIDR